MAWISKNVDLGPALKLSPWRKVAIGTWQTVGDPSVYGILDFDAGPCLKYIEKLREKSGLHVTLTHLLGKAVALTLAKHPEINCTLRFGRLYPRKTIDIFFQVASDQTGKDLSGATLRNAETKSVLEICQEMNQSIETIRKKGDPGFRRMKSMMGLIPGGLVKYVIHWTSFILYTLNLWSPIFGSPRDPFGGVMITNIGSLGLDIAFAPLVPYSRVPILITVGSIRETPVIQKGQIVAAPICQLACTIDHRMIDGVHGSKMAATLKELLADPEKMMP